MQVDDLKGIMVRNIGELLMSFPMAQWRLKDLFLIWGCKIIMELDVHLIESEILAVCEHRAFLHFNMNAVCCGWIRGWVSESSDENWRITVSNVSQISPTIW